MPEGGGMKFLEKEIQYYIKIERNNGFIHWKNKIY